MVTQSLALVIGKASMWLAGGGDFARGIDVAPPFFAGALAINRV